MILFFLYFFLILLVFCQLRIAYKSEKKYQLQFLKYFQTYLIFFFIYGFIKYIGLVCMFEFFPGILDEAALTFLVAILIFPFFSITLFIMILWIRNLAGKKISILLIIVFWTIQLVLFLFMIFDFVIKKKILTAYSVKSWLPIHIAEVIILSAIIVQLFFLKKDLKIKIKAQFLKNLGWILVLSFAIFEIYQNLSDSFLGSLPSLNYAVISSLYFCINMPALIYIHFFLSNHSHEMIDQDLTINEMNQFSKAYNITPREKEIIELIISGKSNQEIGKCLFISIQTVKNINYNIYKKTNIKNRIQLINLVHGFKMSIRK
jgi:DNA-binding CsgD family transcriptional regulator